MATGALVADYTSLQLCPLRLIVCFIDCLFTGRLHLTVLLLSLVQVYSGTSVIWTQLSRFLINQIANAEMTVLLE